MRWAATAFLFFQFGQDPIRQHEWKERAIRSQVETASRERAALEARQRRKFEQRFDALVSAVELFAKEYNHSKGQVWPKDRADKLRAAMEQLQDADPALRPARQPKLRCDGR